MTDLQHMILEALADHPKRWITARLVTMQCGMSSATGPLNRLTDSGHVERIISTEGPLYRITAAGLNALEEK